MLYVCLLVVLFGGRECLALADSDTLSELCNLAHGEVLPLWIVLHKVLVVVKELVLHLRTNCCLGNGLDAEVLYLGDDQFI